MTNNQRRTEVYTRQNGAARFTPRQRRRVLKKQRKAEKSL